MSCVIAFNDPIATFINRVISDAKSEENPADLHLESGINAFEMINDSVTSNSILLNKIKDNAENVRAGIDAVKIELKLLGAKLGKSDTALTNLRKCPSCGKDVSPDFKLCPYCGENCYFTYKYPPYANRTTVFRENSTYFFLAREKLMSDLLID